MIKTKKYVANNISIHDIPRNNQIMLFFEVIYIIDIKDQGEKELVAGWYPYPIGVDPTK